MKNILLFFGTRPEFLKLVPIIKEAKKYNDINIITINSGQHKEMLDQMISLYNVDIDYHLNSMKSNQSITSLSSDLFNLFDKLLQNNRDIFCSMVQGDTTTATIGALWSFYNKIPVHHIEAGLRSYDLYDPYPEEGNRKIISSITTSHYVPTEYNKECLLKENIINNIYVVGNTIIDNIEYYKSLNYKPQSSILQNIDKKFILITLHRRENHNKMNNLCDAIIELNNKYDDISFVLPVHLNPNVKNVIYDKLSNQRDIHLIPPVSYFDFLYLIEKCHFIMTDSGGIQEEAPSFNKYVMVLRETTERIEGISAGCSFLVGTNKNKIMNVFNGLYNKSGYKLVNPFGDGTSSKKILNIISQMEN